MIEEKDLIRRAGQGDSDAFRQLVETYQAPVYRLALRMCGGDAALAEDAAQEAFLAAWRGLPRFRGDSRLSTWRRRNPRRASQLARCAGIGFLARYVYPYGAQRAAACRRFGQPVCVNPFERQGTQCGTHRARHASRQRIYRRWSIDGRGQRRNALRMLHLKLEAN